MFPDTHRLGRVEAGDLLLHQDAAVTWYILVPTTEAVDLLDLPRSERERILDVCAALCRHLKDDRGFPKVNVAAIGNVVPQLHIHVVGRHPGDACWPAPVWGHLATAERYSPERLAEIATELTSVVGLRRD